MYKFYKDNSKNDSIPQRFSVEELLRIGLSCADEGDADLIVGATLEDILPAIQKYHNRKRYLIWCDEPLWSNIFTKLDKPSYYFKDGQFYDYWVSDAAQIAVMNCFTGDVYFSNHHFLLDGYLLGSNCLLEISKRQGFDPSFKGQGRKIAAFFGYRNAAKWFFESKLHGIRSLCNIRTTVALEGWIHGKVDIFGEGWPIKGITSKCMMGR